MFQNNPYYQIIAVMEYQISSAQLNEMHLLLMANTLDITLKILST
jgi:hypothetical protein